MSKILIPIAAGLACLSLAGTPALATDDPPQPPPAPAGTAPAGTVPTTTPPIPTPPPCVDTRRPTTHLATSSRTAAKRHSLGGTALDGGCSGSSVAIVSVSIALQHGKNCQFLGHGARLSRKSTSCKRPHWLSAKGTKQWSIRLPKRMPHGHYQVLTRAVDSAGNVERAHARRLAISRSR